MPLYLDSARSAAVPGEECAITGSEVLEPLPRESKQLFRIQWVALGSIPFWAECLSPITASLLQKHESTSGIRIIGTDRSFPPAWLDLWHSPKLIIGIGCLTYSGWSVAVLSHSRSNRRVAPFL